MAKAPSPRLGRGLAALMGEPPAASRYDPNPPTLLSIASLEPSPFQPRIHAEDPELEELTVSIRAQGVLQPLLVRPHPNAADRFQIIAGERRWRAAQAAGLHAVPVTVRRFSDAEALAASLIENLQRENLDPIEEALGYRRLLDEFGMTQETLGNFVGKSRSHIANTLRLLCLPPSVQAEMQRGLISAGHARALLSHPNPNEAAKIVIGRGLNVRQTEALATRARSSAANATGEGAAPSGEAAGDPDVALIKRQLTEHLGLKVELVSSGKRGRLTLHFSSLDQLDGLLGLLLAGKI